MKINIADVLGFNKLDYLNYKTDQFNIWCALLSRETYVPKRVYMMCEPLYEWYSANWNNNIAQFFLPNNHDYLVEGLKDEVVFTKLFEIEVIEPLQSIYPSAIVDKLKKEHYAKIKHLPKDKEIATTTKKNQQFKR